MKKTPIVMTLLACTAIPIIVKDYTAHKEYAKHYAELVESSPSLKRKLELDESMRSLERSLRSLCRPQFARAYHNPFDPLTAEGKEFIERYQILQKTRQELTDLTESSEVLSMEKRVEEERIAYMKRRPSDILGIYALIAGGIVSSYLLYRIAKRVISQ